jgi:UDP-N-acetylmuramate dehydrogenase
MILSPLHIGEIREIIRGRIEADASLQRFTSFKIGGPADLVAEPGSASELASLHLYLTEQEIPYVLLGSGTNVLFHDKGFRGVVVRLTSIDGFSVEENGSDHALITVAAGVPLPLVVSRTARTGWTGMEPLWGIPGSFGGAVVTNAGAGGVSIGERLEQVKLMTRSNEMITLGKDSVRFGYRSMLLPRGAIVLEGTIRLCRADLRFTEAELDRARVRRRSSQPWDRPSAGCIFKNPDPNNPAGALIDRLGFKGAQVGDARVSEVHANFIVNRGAATAADVMELIEKIKRRVRAEEGIELELEIRVMGEEAAHV